MDSKAQKEGRLLLAMQAYQNSQFSSVRQAALTYNVPPKNLENRLKGRVARVEMRANGHKLTPTEEEALIKWIISIDNRGFSPRVNTVRDAARLLLSERVGSSAFIGKNWPTNFIKRTPALKSRFNRKYDYKRALCEDPVIIEAWFRLVQNTIGKYGILNDDIYNFDETGFALGVASTSRVVTASDRQGRPP